MTPQAGSPAIKGAKHAQCLAAQIVDSVLRRQPDPTRHSSEWGEILLMEGLLAYWRMSQDRRCLDYVTCWLDHHIALGFHVDRRQPHPTSWGPLIPALCLFEVTRKPAYIGLVEEACQYICHHADRLENGALQHYTGTQQTWIDTLYYTVPAFSKLAVIGHQRDYFEKALEQIFALVGVLRSAEDGLLYHMYDEITKTHSGWFWGRGNGWATMALVDTLACLPRMHPGRDRLVDILRLLLQRIVETQDPSGAFRTVLDRPDTYLETSASCMFLYSLAKGMTNGDVAPKEAPNAHRVWQAVSACVTPEGQVVGVSGPTTPGDLLHYQTIPQGEYLWGTGSFLKAAEAYADFSDRPSWRTE